jgi:hypothetical protein
VIEVLVEVTLSGAAATVGALANMNVFLIENGPNPLPD